MIRLPMCHAEEELLTSEVIRQHSGNCFIISQLKPKTKRLNELRKFYLNLQALSIIVIDQETVFNKASTHGFLGTSQLGEIGFLISNIM